MEILETKNKEKKPLLDSAFIGDALLPLNLALHNERMKIAKIKEHEPMKLETYEEYMKHMNIVDYINEENKEVLGKVDELINKLNETLKTPKTMDIVEVERQYDMLSDLLPLLNSFKSKDALALINLFETAYRPTEKVD